MLAVCFLILMVGVCACCAYVLFFRIELLIVMFGVLLCALSYALLDGCFSCLLFIYLFVVLLIAICCCILIFGFACVYLLSGNCYFVFIVCYVLLCECDMIVWCSALDCYSGLIALFLFWLLPYFAVELVIWLGYTIRFAFL